MAEELPNGSRLQQAIACELDCKVLSNIVKAAQDARDAKLRAESAAKSLRCAQIVRDMDVVAFEQREIDICETKLLDDRHVQANIYFASWSKMKERHFQEGVAAGTSNEAPLSVEREFVTRLAGDAILRWNWLGRVEWCRLPRQASDSRTSSEIMKEIMEARSHMMKSLNAFYRSQTEFELVGVEFILRSPSFNLMDQGLNDFLRELIDGATICLKLKLRSRPVKTCLSDAVARILGRESLACRALDVRGFPTLGDAVAVAFSKVFPKSITRYLCAFLPNSGDVASCLNDLAKHHADRAARDTREAESILRRTYKKARVSIDRVS